MRILTVISGEMTVASGARAQKQLRVKSVEKKLSEGPRVTASCLYVDRRTECGERSSHPSGMQH
jgi:hypothetical protein